MSLFKCVCVWHSFKDKRAYSPARPLPHTKCAVVTHYNEAMRNACVFRRVDHGKTDWEFHRMQNRSGQKSFQSQCPRVLQAGSRWGGGGSGERMGSAPGKITIDGGTK